MTACDRIDFALREEDGPDGTLRISVSLHNSDHTVYPNPPNPDDPIEEQEAALNRLATDSIDVVVE